MLKFISVCWNDKFCIYCFFSNVSNLKLENKVNETYKQRVLLFNERTYMYSLKLPAYLLVRVVKVSSDCKLLLAYPLADRVLGRRPATDLRKDIHVFHFQLTKQTTLTMSPEWTFGPTCNIKVNLI